MRALGLPMNGAATFLGMAGKRGDRERTDFARRLIAARKAAVMTQEALAEAAGLSQGTMGEMETVALGSAHTPKLAGILGVRAEWLATGEGAMREVSQFPLPVVQLARALLEFDAETRGRLIEFCMALVETERGRATTKIPAAATATPSNEAKSGTG